MTYKEIKRRLSKCEKTLEMFKSKDYKRSSTDERQQAQRDIKLLNERISEYKKLLLTEEKTYILTPKSGKPTAASLGDDEVDALKDADDIQAIKGADGEEVKERLNKNSGVDFSVEETKSIATKVGKAVAKALKAVGDSIQTMKATHIEENSFDIEVIYKNNSDDAFSFHIINDTLHLADFSFNKELVDVGTKPSGEAIVHVDHLANELQKHFNSLSENVNEVNYDHYKETKHFDICPGATALRDKLIDGGKSPEELGEWTFKHDELFRLEKAVIKANKADSKAVKAAENLRAEIIHLSRELGIDADDIAYLKGHVDKIRDISSGKNEVVNDKDTKDLKKLSKALKGSSAAHLDQKKKLDKLINTEGAGDDHHYLKVPSAEYKKALSILDQNIDPTYVKMDVVDNDGAGNVIFYFIFKHEDGFDDMYGDAEADSEFYQEPEEDGEAFVYDAAMDLRANDITVVDSSADMDEEVKEGDNEGYTKHKLLAYLGQSDDAMIRTHDDKYLIIYNPKKGNDDNAAMWHDDTVFGVDHDGEEHEVRYDQIDRLQLEKYDPDQEQKDDEEDHGVGYDDEGRPLGETDEARDLNDPVLMRMRVAKKRNADLKKVDQIHARDRKDQRINGKKRLLIKQLKDKRAEIEREMENDPEIEPTGGPVADRYGDMLNKIDNAIEKASGRIKPMDYDTAVGKVNEDEGHLVTFGYDLNSIEDVVKHLQSKYKEGQDYELHVGRGDTHPNAVTLKSPALEDDHDLNDMLNAAQDDQDRYDAYTDYDQRRKEDDDYYEDPDYYKESMKEGTELYDKGGMQIKRFSGGKRGVMVQITVPSATGFGGDYIQVTPDQFATLAKAMQSVQGDLMNMSTQIPRRKNIDEIKAAKVQKAYGLVIAKMKELAKQYKAGDHSVVDQLKDLTAKKKALEADLDQAVAGTHQGQELTELSSEQRNELVELQNILDDVAQKGDEAREIIRQSFPRMLSKADAYGAFEFGSSANRYDTTLESIIEEIEEYYDEEDEDDDEYNESINESLNPEVSKKVAQFIKAMAKRYDYKEQDAVYAIMAALKQRDFDGVDENKILKEFTDNSFKGSELIDDANSNAPDMFGKQLFSDLLPKGVASENNAIEALKKHDASGIKARMKQYAPMFVHVQYHELEHEGEYYRMHQRQYYNSNFKDTDPDFNPAVSKITIFKITKKAADRRDKEESVNLGTILVRTDEYVQDLRNLPGLGKRNMEEATRQDLGMVSSISKRRAKAHLKNPSNDGSKVYGLDKDGKRVRIRSINDVDKFKRFEIDADLDEAGPGFKHDCAAHVVHEVYGAGICLDEQHTLVKEGNKHVVTHYDVFFKKGNRLVEDVPAEHLKVITMNEHWHKGYKKKKK